MIDSYHAYAVLNKKPHLWIDVVYLTKDNPLENTSHKFYPISEKKAADIRALLMKCPTSEKPNEIQNKICKLIFNTNRLRRNANSDKYKQDMEKALEYVFAGNSASRAAMLYDLNPSTIRGRVRKLRMASQGK